MQYDQLPLPFQHRPRFDARDFVPASSNQEALAWLDTDWPDHRLALFGPAGCGKSHLLHVWAERRNALLLPAPALVDLDDLPPGGAVALDDADTVGNETLLFHFLNQARERRLHLLLASRVAPSHWSVNLPDLSSRLRALSAVEIRPPSDDLLATLLVRLIADRQLAVPPPLQKWMLLRLPRSPAALREAIARLDRESLISGMAITRTLAVRALSDFLIAEPEQQPMPDGVPSSAAGDFL
jgi:chromosomal replication initiation ATPase DnaA